jgi:hypothetical protein
MRLPVLEKNRCKKLSLIILAIFLMTSCLYHKPLITFEGTLTYAENATIYLAQLTPDGLFFIDSCAVKQGKFKLAMRKESDKSRDYYAIPSFYRIQMKDKNNNIVLPAKAGDNITLAADARNLVKNYTANGSVDVQLMQQLDNRLKSFIDSTDRLQLFYTQHIEDDTARMQVEEAYNQLVAHHTAFLRQFIAQNSQSMVTIMAFYQLYNQKRFFSETDDLALLKSIYANLNRLYPQSEHVLFLKERITPS